MTTTAQLPAATIRGSRFDGQVLTPGTRGYDSARVVWNGMIDHRPKLIAQCASVDDIVTAVRTARECDLEIGVRCGGHNIAGLAVPDGGLMIDLTTLGRVTVDPVTRRARVQGGAMLGALDRATQPFGLATTAEQLHTGVGGLTLGGGMGGLRASTVSPATTSCPTPSSPRTATSCARPPMRTPTCSGVCAAVAATSESSPSSSSGCIPSARGPWSWSSPSRSIAPPQRCAAGATWPRRPPGHADRRDLRRHRHPRIRVGGRPGGRPGDAAGAALRRRAGRRGRARTFLHRTPDPRRQRRGPRVPALLEGPLPPRPVRRRDRGDCGPRPGGRHPAGRQPPGLWRRDRRRRR